MQALMLRSLALIMVCSQGSAWVRAPTLRPPSSRNGFLDDALDNVKSGLAKMSQTATVQHVLVPSRTTALKLQRECWPSVWNEAPRHRRDGSVHHAGRRRRA